MSCTYGCSIIQFMCILLQPFWPTGSGCGRGFLGAFDAAWMFKRFCDGTSPMELVEEREALFYLLPQTTPERLAKNLTGYTIDPKTRYPNLSKWCLSVFALLWRTLKLALRLGFLFI